VGVRATLGGRLTPLALRALLVHAADPGDGGREQNGWGRVPADLEDLVVCGDGVVRVVYQGRLDAARFLRTPVPLPSRTLAGMVTIRATFVIAAPVDPAFSETYTQAGLDVVFRPHSGVFGDGGASALPKSSSFFRLSDYSTEANLRHDAHKWETVMHRGKRMQARSLQAPAFDVHCLTRAGGAASRTAAQVPYAAVISVIAPSEPNLYNEVLAAYPGQLQALAPVVDLPVRL